MSDSTSALETLGITRDVPRRTPDVKAFNRGVSPAAKVVAQWHDGAHVDPFSTCQDQPCLAVKQVDC